MSAGVGGAERGEAGQDDAGRDQPGRLQTRQHPRGPVHRHRQVSPTREEEPPFCSGSISPFLTNDAKVKSLAIFCGIKAQTLSEPVGILREKVSAPP